MANPSGTRTPKGDSDRIISPSEAFLPPTRPTSDRPTSENQRTKRMHAPPAARGSHGPARPPRVGPLLDRASAGPLGAGGPHKSQLRRGGGANSLEDSVCDACGG